MKDLKRRHKTIDLIKRIEQLVSKHGKKVVQDAVGESLDCLDTRCKRGDAFRNNTIERLNNAINQL